MAQLKLKQLDSVLTGSLQVSGSSGVTGSLGVSSTGSFAYLSVSGNSSLTGDLTLGGNIQIGDSDTDSITITSDLTSNLTPNADSTYDIGSSTKYWRNAYLDTITTTGNVSGSSISTGSFGRIDSSGRIFEQGSSVIDHATAMAIVFGG